MKFKIKVESIGNNNYWYILLKNDREIARAGYRQAVIDIIVNYVKMKMVEDDTIAIND